MDSSVTQFASLVLAHVQDALWALASRLCGSGSAPLVLNGRTYEIQRVLGEGGFSIVFLVRDTASGQLFALKKIRCVHGAESLRGALTEIDTTRRFKGKHVVRIVDVCVTQDLAGGGPRLGNIPAHDEESGSAKLVYILMPYYARGSVQDVINSHALHGTRYDEREMLQTFLDVCAAVRRMHEYHVGKPDAGAETAAAAYDTEIAVATAAPLIDEPSMHAKPYGGPSSDSLATSAARPYAHRDLKPANIMLDDDGSAVLVDFGSAIPARVHIRSRREAVSHQDMAAEHSSMPYRAPELFDIKTDTTLDEQTDIWSLGCVLYAMAFLHSPFETHDTTEQGGSVALAVTNGAYRMPEGYSEATRNLIAACLVDAASRPRIAQVEAAAAAALDAL
ncbi:non-specific serine/threonine protein kinase [Malassezia cuniculi]|uniref:non-specific serine/threonine protein kinase n=1 Tax=Malassezia cuniculi TaxID=948313 RepID=A0AAF0EXF0_9BASI|nr:non-specific serine/threonine protein kinase [Malassezia cuniculi]